MPGSSFGTEADKDLDKTVEMLQEAHTLVHQDAAISSLLDTALLMKTSGLVFPVKFYQF